MKQIFKRIFILALLLTAILPTEVLSQETTHSARQLTLRKKKKGKDHFISNDKDGQRAPMRPLCCTIDGNGVNISGFYEDIHTYEVWDVEGEVCLAQFADESCFIEYVFSYEDEMQIRLITEEYELIGFL